MKAPPKTISIALSRDDLATLNRAAQLLCGTGELLSQHSAPNAASNAASTTAIGLKLFTLAVRTHVEWAKSLDTLGAGRK